MCKTCGILGNYNYIYIYIYVLYTSEFEDEILTVPLHEIISSSVLNERLKCKFTDGGRKTRCKITGK